jgi:hypothetical protein
MDEKYGKMFVEASVQDLLEHVGHNITVATYAGEEGIANVALECEDCNEVLADKNVMEGNNETQ